MPGKSKTHHAEPAGTNASPTPRVGQGWPGPNRAYRSPSGKRLGTRRQRLARGLESRNRAVSDVDHATRAARHTNTMLPALKRVPPGARREAARTARHKMLAAMVVSGKTEKACAEFFCVSRRSIRKWQDSNSFRVAVAELQQARDGGAVDKFLDRIEREFHPSIDKIVELREGDFGNPAAAAVQLNAAKFLAGDLFMDRRYPKITREEHDGELRVVFGADAVAQMRNALNNAKRPQVIEIASEPIPQLETRSTADDADAQAQHVDSVLAELEASEAADLLVNPDVRRRPRDSHVDAA